MKVTNKSNNTLLSDSLKEASSFSDRFFGLLKTSNPRCLMFKTRFGIHTFFLKEPIDVIILDDKLRVVKIKTVKPNRFFFWHPRFSQVLELPCETAKKTKTRVGDTLEIT